MRILLINYSDIKNPGGVHKTIREMAKNLTIMGHDVTVLQTNPLNSPVEEIYDGYKIIRIKSSISKYLYGYSPKLYFYLRNNLNKLNPDIIHVHGCHTLFSSEIIAYCTKRHYLLVFSPHYGPNSHNTLAGKYLWGLFTAYNKNLFNSVTRVFCASNYEFDNFIHDFNISPEKCVIIPHGVDRIQELSDKIKNDYISLLYVGYLLELKGVQYILHALSKLKFDHNVNVRLTIVGDGEYKNELTKLANDLSILDNIIWTKNIFGEELNEQYRQSDIFLLLSRSENYGIVVAEALSMGVPCIVSNTTALSEFLQEPGCYGINYPPNISTLTELIIKISKSNINVGPFSNRIRPWNQVIYDYENYYLKTLRSRNENP